MKHEPEKKKNLKVLSFYLKYFFFRKETMFTLFFFKKKSSA